MDLEKILPLVLLIGYIGMLAYGIISDIIQDAKNRLDQTDLDNRTNPTIRDRFVQLQSFVQAVLAFLTSIVKVVVFICFWLTVIWFIGTSLENVPQRDPYDSYDGPYG